MTKGNACFVVTYEFHSPKELRIAMGEYIEEYNTIRPHEAHDHATPDKIYFSKSNAAA